MALLIALVCIGIAARVIFCYTAGIIRSGDESTYHRMAKTISSYGFAGILIEEQRGRAKLPVDFAWRTWPLEVAEYIALSRPAWYIPIAAIYRISGPNFNVGAVYACICNILSLGLMVWMALRYFGSVAATFSALFISLSILDLGIACRSRPDAPLELACLIIMAATLHILNDRKTWSGYAVFFTATLTAVMLKESAALFSALCLLCLAIPMVRAHEWRMLAAVSGIYVVAVFLAASTTAYLVGGFGNLRIIISTANLCARCPFAQVYQSGRWYVFPMIFMMVAILPSIMFVVGLFFMRRAPVAAVMAIVAVAFTAIVTASNIHFIYNARFLAPILPLFYMVAGYGFSRLFDILSKRAGLGRAILYGSAVICVFWMVELSQLHQRYFDTWRLTDLNCYWLTLRTYIEYQNPNLRHPI